MTEERMKILNMLHDGIITPEQAERLLEALADTARAEETSSRRKRRPPHGPFIFDEFGDILNEQTNGEFEQKMRAFHETLRSAGQDAARQAREAMRQAGESLKQAFQGSDMREAWSEFGRRMAEVMETVAGGAARTETAADETAHEPTGPADKSGASSEKPSEESSPPEESAQR